MTVLRGTGARRVSVAAQLVAASLVMLGVRGEPAAAAPQPSVCTVSASAYQDSFDDSTTFDGPLTCGDLRGGTFTLHLDRFDPSFARATTTVDGVMTNYAAITQIARPLVQQEFSDTYDFTIAFAVTSGPAKGAVVPWNVTVTYTFVNFDSTHAELVGAATVIAATPSSPPPVRTCTSALGPVVCAGTDANATPSVTGDRVPGQGPTKLDGVLTAESGLTDGDGAQYLRGTMTLEGVYNGNTIAGAFNCFARGQHDWTARAYFDCFPVVSPARVELGPLPTFDDYASLDLGYDDDVPYLAGVATLAVLLGDGSTLTCASPAVGVGARIMTCSAS